MNVYRSLLFVSSCFLLTAAAAQAQSLTVNPLQIRLQMVETGPLSANQPITVTTTSPWQIALGSGSADMLELNKTKGTTSDSVIPGLGWWAASRPAGTYVQTLTFSLTGSPQTTQTVTVTLVVIAKLANPKYSYFTGPTGCVALSGYLDNPICTVPGEKPAGNFTPPPAGQSYTDPNFGARVRVFSDPRSSHGYSTPSAISANNRYAITYQWSDTSSRIMDVKTGKVLRPGVGVYFEGAIWDARDDDKIYSFQGATIKQYSVSTNQLSTVFDFSAAPYRFTKLSNGGTGDGSKDNWITFYAPDQQQVCAFAIDTGTPYCASYTGIIQGNLTVDFPMITKGPDKGNGKRYVILSAVPNSLFFSVNLAAKKLDYVYKGGE